MALNWKGEQIKRASRRKQIIGVNTTMSAAVLHAKENHQPGAHASDRFESQTGALEGSINITEAAHEIPGGVKGTWGSQDIAYALRIELGFQGQDSAGRVIDQQAFPFLRPAADAEYPNLWRRIARA